MDAGMRREQLIRLLRDSKKPLSGGYLAEELGVSRQIIVQDIALLRAAGQDILATPQGYILTSSLKGRLKQVVACQHGPGEIEAELSTVIELGGRIVDVIVEHPLYGELRGLLLLTTLQDVKEYMEKFVSSKAEPLSALTKGVHLHTIEADDQQHFKLIREELKRKGLLLQEV